MSLWENPLAVGLIVLTAAAFAIGLVSLLRAWRLAARHQPFRDLGHKRWFMAHRVLPHLPEAAVPHMKRHLFSLLVMTSSLAALFVLIWATPAH